MIATYDIGTLSAELQLTLLASRQGHVLRDQLSWHLICLSKEKPNVYDSNDPTPLFSVKEGKYQIQAIYQENTYDFGKVSLKQNTRIDAVYILNTDHVDNEYFTEIDPVDDFSRRQKERDDQSKHGHATLPLRDPSMQIEGDYGSQILAHPLLAQSVQFDGIPPDMRPDPAENEAALQLTLSAQLTNQPDAVATPTPNPGR